MMKKHRILTLCLMWLAAFAMSNSVPAQDTHELTHPQAPLKHALNREGALDLKRDFHGSVDPADWQMTAGSNGEPRSVSAAAAQQTSGAAQLLAVPGDENWDDRFGTQGLNGGVMTIAVSGSEVYVGGRFTVAGTVEANNIAKWDGASWSPLGSGVNGQVSAIAVSGKEVYAGGWFTTAGGVAANYIAKWDGSSWSAVGGGIGTGEYWGVFALAANETEVYVGGQFTTAGEVTANNIAKWDGASWSALGSGMNGDVHTLAVSGDTLYAGGGFGSAGGVAASCIAMWDGMNWSALGSGTDNTTVRVIAVSGSKVYAGGEFIRAGDVTANYIAAWDGTSWSAMGGGVESLEGFDQDMVFSIATRGNEVYAGGLFIKAGGVEVNRIAKWDGASWSALGSGVDSDEFFTNVFALAMGRGELYAGGTFTTAGDKPSLYFGRYVLNTPPTADAGLDQQTCNGKAISIGGSPAATDGTAPYTYSWAPATGLDNATAANPLASPTATTVYALTVTDANGLTDTDEVTVTVKGTCKRFVFLANKVTLKSTKQITPAGDIHSNGILTVEKGDPSVYNSNLTAVGKITIQKDNTINGDVASPLAISNAGTINGTITVGPVASEPLPSKSYSAGGLNRTVPSGGSLVLAPGSYNLVTLNSGGTLRLTSGDYFFNELRYPGSEAVIEFDLSSGNAANVNLVSNFQFGKEAAIRLLPNGETDSELVTFFTLQSTAVSMGKEAYFLGTLNAPNALVTLVKNSQLRGSICAKEILVDKDCLFLHHDSPGSLPGPGNLPKPSFEEDGQQETSNQQPVTSYQLEQNFPNPFNPVTTIQFSVPRASHVRLKVYNTSGAEVATLVDQQIAPGTYKVNWDASRMASGFYLYRLEVEGFAQTKKLLLMK